MNAIIEGTWKLKSFEVKTKDGSIIYPYGEDATGLVIYSNTGYYSIQFMPHVQCSGDLKGISYFGKYEYNREKDYIIHHVEGSLYSGMEDMDKIRFSKIRGKNLTLTCPPLLWDDDTATTATIHFEKQDEIPELRVTEHLVR